MKTLRVTVMCISLVCSYEEIQFYMGVIDEIHLQKPQVKTLTMFILFLKHNYRMNS